jgi:hypothetical protein
VDGSGRYRGHRRRRMTAVDAFAAGLIALNPQADPDAEERATARKQLRFAQENHARAVSEGHDPTYWDGSIKRNLRRLAAISPAPRPTHQLRTRPTRRGTGRQICRSHRPCRASGDSRAGPSDDGGPEGEPEPPDVERAT